jgi:hypothetical protein
MTRIDRAGAAATEGASAAHMISQMIVSPNERMACG